MMITIEYCGQFLSNLVNDYKTRAVSLETAIREDTIIDDISLVKGKNSVFNVSVDGHEIWSKDNVGRFPVNGEILDKIILYDLGRPKCGLPDDDEDYEYTSANPSDSNI